MGINNNKRYVTFVFAIFFVLAGSFPMMGQAQDRKSYEIKQHAIKTAIGKAKKIRAYDEYMLCTRDIHCGYNEECYKNECVTQGMEECEKNCDKETHGCVDIDVKIVCVEKNYPILFSCETNDDCFDGQACYQYGAAKMCVQWCDNDAECGTGRVCSNITKFCVEEDDPSWGNKP